MKFNFMTGLAIKPLTFQQVMGIIGSFDQERLKVKNLPDADEIQRIRRIQSLTIPSIAFKEVSGGKREAYYKPSKKPFPFPLAAIENIGRFYLKEPCVTRMMLFYLQSVRDEQTAISEVNQSSKKYKNNLYQLNAASKQILAHLGERVTSIHPRGYFEELMKQVFVHHFMKLGFQGKQELLHQLGVNFSDEMNWRMVGQVYEDAQEDIIEQGENHVSRAAIQEIDALRKQYEWSYYYQDKPLQMTLSVATYAASLGAFGKYFNIFSWIFRYVGPVLGVHIVFRVFQQSLKIQAMKAPNFFKRFFELGVWLGWAPRRCYDLFNLQPRGDALAKQFSQNWERHLSTNAKFYSPLQCAHVVPIWNQKIQELLQIKS